MKKNERLRLRELIDRTSISDLDGHEWCSPNEIWDYFMGAVTDDDRKKWEQIVLHINFDYDDYSGESQGYIEVVGYHDETDEEFAKRKAKEAEFNKKKRAEAAERKKEEEERERAEYERLKTKYGNG